MGFKTPLYETHVAAGARMVDFGGWDMPVHYGSQIEEHHAVRRDAGMFDVSHRSLTSHPEKVQAMSLNFLFSVSHASNAGAVIGCA